MVWCGAAAAADDADESRFGEIAQQRRGLVGQLVVLSERVREARVRVAGDVALRDARQLREIRPHLARAEGAVQPDAERARVPDRDVERVERLARQRAPAAIGDRHRDHQRKLHALLLERLEHRSDGRLRVQRVEDRLDEHEIDAAVDQSPRLRLIGVADVIERHGAKGRIVDVGGNRERPVGRADGACHEARPVRRLRAPLVRSRPREACPLHVELVCERLERVVALRNRGRRKRVRLDDVGARRQVRVMDVPDDIGSRQGQQIVVALQVARVVAKPLTAEIRLGEAVALNHCPHRAVEEEDACREKLVQPVDGHHG